MQPAARDAAQQRVDRIGAFHAELSALEGENVLVLTADQKGAVLRHHAALEEDLARRFDVDRTQRERRLSLGMRLVSFLGAAALCAAVVLFLYRVWGSLSVAAQLGVLMAAPVLGVVATALGARLDRTRYFASMAALVAFGAFGANLQVGHEMFNMRGSPHALAALAAFGAALAYAHGLSLVLVAALICFTGWVGAVTTMLAGGSWHALFERPENLLIAGALLAGVSLLPHGDARAPLARVHRVFGAGVVLLALLVLGQDWLGSYLPFGSSTLQRTYQIVGFVVAAACIWIGVRTGVPELVTGGTLGFASMLLLRFIDWWWDRLPRYLFFLVIGLLAIGLLLALQRLRRRAGSLP